MTATSHRPRLPDRVAAAAAWGIDAVRAPLVGSGPTRRELLVAGVLLTLLAAAVYVPHVVRGGWYLDDWIFVAMMSDAGGPLDVLRTLHADSHRPGLIVSLGAFYAIAGEGQSTYLTIGVALTALQGWLFYVVLRQMGMRAAMAGVAGATFIALPCIDATRLWMAAFPIQVSGSLYLAGTAVALWGLTRAVGRRALVWHVGAAVLYCSAILTYELAAGLVALTPLLYAVRLDWRAALRRLPGDYIAIAVALAAIAPRAAGARGADTSIGYIWDRALQMWTPAQEVFRTLLPWSDVLGGPIGLVLLLAGVLGAGIAIGRGDRAGGGLWQWFAIAGVATLFALAGLVMLLPADPYFVPRLSGLGNRTGAFAAFGAVVLLVSLIVVTAGGLGALARRPAAGFAVAAIVVLATASSLVLREWRQQDPWAEAWQEQQRVVAAVGTAMGGDIPDDAAIVSFGHPTFLRSDVSVFAYSWDLRGALWETYDAPAVTAHPWVEGAQCGARGVVFPGATTTPSGSQPYGYGRVVFIDVESRTARRVQSRDACSRIVTRLTS